MLCHTLRDLKELDWLCGVYERRRKNIRLLEWQQSLDKQNIGEPSTRWTDNLKRINCNWILWVQHSKQWVVIGNTYVQLWRRMVGWSWWRLDLNGHAAVFDWLFIIHESTKQLKKISIMSLRILFWLAKTCSL